MKLLIICLLSTLSLAGFSQTAKEPKIDAQPKTVTLTLTEQQMVDLHLILIAGRPGLFDSEQLSAHAAKGLALFDDSLDNVFILQSMKWHPQPLPKVKQDSTHTK